MYGAAVTSAGHACTPGNEVVADGPAVVHMFEPAQHLVFQIGILCHMQRLSKRVLVVVTCDGNHVVIWIGADDEQHIRVFIDTAACMI